jgi:hypothetical protein
MESHIPYLLQKMVFLGLQNYAIPLGRKGKNFFANFELYDLANGKE